MRFAQATGIRESDWSGKHWAKWSEAIVEAGFVPNSLNPAFPDGRLIESFIALMRELGRFPVSADLKLKSSRDPAFPSRNTFSRLGRKSALAAKLLAYCNSRPGYEDVIPFCTPLMEGEEAGSETPTPESVVIGCVYLLKAARHYKIGRSNTLERRERELAIQLPTRAATVHIIRTDDPSGIEAYWHRRFAAKRLNGEWFALSPEDVSAFRRRKFM